MVGLEKEDRGATASTESKATPNVQELLEKQTGGDKLEELPYNVLPRGYHGPLPPGYVYTNMFTAMREGDNQDTLRKLAITSLAMAVLPLSGFFAMRDHFLPRWGVNSNQDMISALVAILIVQVIIGLYVLMAFSEREERPGIELQPNVEASDIGESKKDR